MSEPARGCPSCGAHESLRLGASFTHGCLACNYRWRPCSDPRCRGYRIINIGSDPSIRGCGSCDIERGGISDTQARTMAAARRAFWRAQEQLETARAKTGEVGPRAAEAETAAIVRRGSAGPRSVAGGDAESIDDEVAADDEDHPIYWGQPSPGRPRPRSRAASDRDTSWRRARYPRPTWPCKAGRFV